MAVTPNTPNLGHEFQEELRRAAIKYVAAGAVGAAVAVVWVFGVNIAESSIDNRVESAVIGRIEEPESKLAATIKATVRNEVPSNAVIAVDDPEGCPAGWQDIGRDDSLRFAGRMLVVAGPTVDDSDRPESEDAGTQKRDYDDEGGREHVALDEDQLAPHDHLLPIGGYGEFKGDPDGGQVVAINHVKGEEQKYTKYSRPTGGSEPHENMPPFIVLHFCKKVS